MIFVWTTPDGRLLVRRGAQPPPWGGAAADALLAGAFAFDLVDPSTGVVLTAYRRRYLLFERTEADHFTSYFVEGDGLAEVLVRVQDTSRHGVSSCELKQRTLLLSGLVAHHGRRWRTPAGELLVEGAPQTTAYGSNPPQPLLDGAHDYDLVDPTSGEALQRWQRSDELIGHGDTEILKRHVVAAQELIEVTFDYYEDSCWGVGNIRGDKRRVLLRGLEPIGGA